jgi:hypothetical protein
MEVWKRNTLNNQRLKIDKHPFVFQPEMEFVILKRVL